MKIQYKNQNRKWNGWGRKNIDYLSDKLSKELLKFLKENLGESVYQNSISKHQLLERIWESKIPLKKVESLKEILFTEKEIRLDYSFGQSFPDWIRFRTGWDLHITDAVSIPRNIDELKRVINFCKKHHYRIIIYGGGTSVVGHILADSDIPVVTISMEKMNRLLHLNKENSFATFEAGVNGPELEDQLRKYGYRFGHYPQSFEFSTLGGWIATRSSGQQSLYYGRIEDLFLGGKILTPQGNIHLFPVPASSAGPDLKHWILGSEGRSGIIYEATIKIRKLPEQEEFHGVFFPDEIQAIEFIKKAISLQTCLSMLRLSFPEETEINLEMAKVTGHSKTIENLKKFLKFKNFTKNYTMMIIGFTGTQKEVKFGKQIIFHLVKEYGGIINQFFISKKLGRSWEKNRFFSPYLRNTLWELGYGVDTLETSLPWESIMIAKEQIEESIIKSAEKFNEKVIVYTHLSHVYLSGSSIYTTYIFRLKKSPEEQFQMWKEIKKQASETIVKLKGTISHQHGVGKDHKPYLKEEKTPIGMDWIRNFIQYSDPQQIFNNQNLIDI